MDQPELSRPVHAMTLVKTYPTGAEEWKCSHCGRRFVMQWPPHYKRIILEVGDEYAYHSASKGGLHLSAPSFVPLSDDAGEFETDRTQSLDNWLEWLDQLDLGDDWDDDPNTATAMS